MINSIVNNDVAHDKLSRAMTTHDQLSRANFNLSHELIRANFILVMINSVEQTMM